MADDYSQAAALEEHIAQREAAGEGENVRKAVAKALRISESVLSQYLGRKYHARGGRPDKVNQGVAEYLAAFQEAEKYEPARVSDLVETAQIREGVVLISFAARHRACVLLAGESGTGKTSAMRWYAEQHPDTAILVELNQTNRSMKSFLKHFWRSVPRLKNADLPKATDDIMDGLITYFRGGREMVLIDEGQFLDMPSLECVRSFQEAAGVGVALSGTFDLDGTLGFGRGQARRRVNAQIHRRIGKRKELTAELSPADVGLFASLYEVSGEAEIAWLHERCNFPGRRYGWLRTMLMEATHVLIDTGLAAITTEILAAVEQDLGL
jgi:DNA transposition AAA+ family ATPase